MRNSNEESPKLQPLPASDSSPCHFGSVDGPDALERHYSLQEVARLWGVSREYVRRLFRGRPGVLHLRKPGLSKRRAYITLRIPASVLREVHREMRDPRQAAVPWPEAEDAAQRQRWLAGVRRRRVESLEKAPSEEESRG
jgi:hypothetical protein